MNRVMAIDSTRNIMKTFRIKYRFLAHVRRVYDNLDNYTLTGYRDVRVISKYDQHASI